MVAPVRRTDHVRHMRLSETDPNMAPKVEARCVNQILSERPYLKSDRIFCEIAEAWANIVVADCARVSVIYSVRNRCSYVSG